MKIAIHQNLNIHSDDYSSGWVKNLVERGIEHVALDFKDENALEIIKECDGAMWHWYHEPDDKQSAPKILDAIEFGLNIPIFPNFKTRFHFDEKISQHYFLKSINAPIIKSWVFWNYEKANEFIEKCNYPIVFKLSVGAGSANVIKLNSCEEAKNKVDEIFKKGVLPYTMNEYADFFTVKNIFRKKRKCIQDTHYALQKNYAYFQEFMPNNEYDIRVTVIGNRAFGFIRHNREGDFRASGSGKIDYDISKIPLEAVRIAHETSKKQGFQSMAYDFLLDKKGAVLINEISYAYMDKAVYDCNGYWDREISWHEGHIMPQDAHVEDFIEHIKNGKLS